MVDGRQRSVFGRTRLEAPERLRTSLTGRDRGERTPDGRRAVAGWLDDWLATTVRPRLRPQTVASYERIVAGHMKPAIGSIPLAKLSATDVARMLDRMTVSGTTRRYTLVVLRAALGRAVKAGAASRNVALLVDLPKRSTVEVPPYSRDQVAALLDATMDDRIGPLLAVAATTGLRQGETLALAWDDVDLDAGALTVRRTLDPSTLTLAQLPLLWGGRAVIEAGSWSRVQGSRRSRRSPGYCRNTGPPAYSPSLASK